MSYDGNMEHTLDIISEIIFNNQLYILPLYSIREGGTCSFWWIEISGCVHIVANLSDDKI